MSSPFPKASLLPDALTDGDSSFPRAFGTDESPSISLKSSRGGVESNERASPSANAADEQRRHALKSSGRPTSVGREVRILAEPRYGSAKLPFNSAGLGAGVATGPRDSIIDIRDFNAALAAWG